MGKCNQIEFDVFGALYQQKYAVEYKRCMTKNFQISITGNILTKNDLIYDYGKKLLGSNTYDGYTWGLGMVFSSPFTNMPLPFGYYTGLAYERTTATYTEFLKNSTAYFAYNNYNYNNTPHDLNLNYLQKGNLIKLTYGKASYLGENFTLDLSLDMGFAFGSYYARDSISNDVQPSAFVDKYNILPILEPRFRTFGAHNYKKYTEADANSYFYYTYYIMPKIKIGYIF